MSDPSRPSAATAEPAVPGAAHSLSSTAARVDRAWNDLRRIATPLAAELLLGLGVGVIGTALAGRQGTVPGAAFALAMQVYATLFVLFRIVGAGVGVVVSQALGAGDRAHADALSRASLGGSGWIGAACALAAALGAPGLLSLIQAPPEVLPVAVPLLQALALGVLLDAWNATLATVLRSHFQARATLGVNAAVQALHLGLALWLMPQLGTLGFAVGLMVSRLLGIALQVHLWRRVLQVRPTVRDFLRWQPQALRPVLAVGLPGAAENIAWRLAFVASVAAAARLGTDAVATQGYTMQVIHLLLLTSLAIGLAGEIVVGHLIGAGDWAAADALVRRTLGRAMGLSAGIAAAAALAGPWLMQAFTQDPAVVRTASLLLAVTVVLETGRAFNLVLVNALRAAGDVRYPVQAGAASFALLLGGGSWLLGPVLGGGLVGIWLAYTADEWVRGLMMWRRWRSGGWQPFAEAVRASHRAP